MDWTIPKLPVADVTNAALDYLTDRFSGVTRAISHTVAAWIDVLTGGLNAVPVWIAIPVLALIIWRITTPKLALLSALGFFLLWDVDLWRATIQTLVLVLLSTAASLTIGIPIGIAAALSRRAWHGVSPVLDLMQTMPSFVYLIPAIPFFGLGAVSACFATIIFSMPPTIRLTALGILQTPGALVEAADAFGSSPMQKLFKLQLPLALPTVMAGINQTIMLALSMVVISAMIGAGGLGGEVWRAIQRLEAGDGFQAGLAIVIVAVILDRITQHIARQAQVH